MIAIRKWHVPIMGFQQGINRITGFDILWRKLRAYADSETSVVTPQRWSGRFDALAEFIWRMQPDPTSPQINIYSYSWGCGRGFIQLSRELDKRGLQVQNAVLCDPVYYSWWRPWRAMVMSPPITIPRNVLNVEWFYQRKNKPCANRLRKESDTTAISIGVRLNTAHPYMDDHPDFHKKCMEVAERL